MPIAAMCGRDQPASAAGIAVRYCRSAYARFWRARVYSFLAGEINCGTAVNVGLSSDASVVAPKVGTAARWRLPHRRPPWRARR